MCINAEKHAFKDILNGKISISVVKETENLKFTFCDNGLGMSDDVRKQIFDPFFTTNKQTGTGLGLHIVFNLVTQKLKGTIECRSQIENGTCFNINFVETENKL
jgi:signal transduction histidine kinase